MRYQADSESAPDTAGLGIDHDLKPYYPEKSGGIFKKVALSTVIVTICLMCGAGLLLFAQSQGLAQNLFQSQTPDQPQTGPKGQTGGQIPNWPQTAQDTNTQGQAGNQPTNQGQPNVVIPDKGLTRFPGKDIYIGPAAPSVYDKEAKAVKDAYIKDIENYKIDLGDRRDKMMVGISIGPDDFKRRHLIRSMQIDPYKNFNIAWRFVMGRPDQLIYEQLKYENATHGDLVILDMEDSRENARTYKPFEWFKYVEANLPVYKYVAKMDSDTYINMATFHKDFFNENIQNANDFSIISLFIKRSGKFEWPQGGFEAVSYKVMLLLNRLYTLVPLTTICEDTQIEWYMTDSGTPYKKIEFTDSRAYDFRKGTHPHYSTNIVQNAVRIHELKSDNDYINVARCFNQQGVNMTHVDLMRKAGWK